MLIYFSVPAALPVDVITAVSAHRGRVSVARPGAHDVARVDEQRSGQVADPRPLLVGCLHLVGTDQRATLNLNSPRAAMRRDEESAQRLHYTTPRRVAS